VLVEVTEHTSVVEDIAWISNEHTVFCSSFCGITVKKSTLSLMRSGKTIDACFRHRMRMGSMHGGISGEGLRMLDNFRRS